MDLREKFKGYNTIYQYLSTQNGRLRKIVEMAAFNVVNAAQQAVQTIEKNRALISDVADHLDNEFVSELEYSPSEEIKEINRLENEFHQFFNRAVWEKEFNEFNKELKEKSKELEIREQDLLHKEANLEETIRLKVAEIETKLREEGTSSRTLFESALVKAEKIIDQNKITRFAYSTISRFQEVFDFIEGTSDVEYITKLFQETIEPFQSTKIITDKDGNRVKIVTNTFSEDCYQDLFFFFYKYYNELTEVHLETGELPSTADELSRIFQKKKMDAEDVVKHVHKKRGTRVL